MHGSTAVAQSSINDFFQSTSAARQKQSQPTKKRKSNKAEEEDHPEEPPKKKGKMKENLAPSTPISARSRNGKRTKKSLAATRPALQDKPAKRASFEHTSDPFTSIIPSPCNTHNRQSTFAEVIDLTGPESPKPSRTFRTAAYLPTPETAMKRAISSRSSPPASSTALHKRMRRTPDTAVQEANNASTPTATVLNRRAPLPTPETFDRRERKWAAFDGSSPLSSPPDSPSAGSQRSPNAKQMADPFIDSVEEVIPSSQTQLLEWNRFKAVNKEEQTTNPFIDPVEELIPSSQTQVLEWNPFEAANKEEQFHYTISRAPAPSGNTNAVFKLPKLPLRAELIPSYHRAASTPPPDDEVVPSSQSQDDLLSFSPWQRASSSPSHYPPFKHDFSKGEIVPSSQSSELEMSSPRSAVKRPPLQIKIPGLVDDEVALHHDDGSAESEGEVIPTSQSPFEKEITASEALRIGEAMKKYFGHKSQDPVLEMSPPSPFLNVLLADNERLRSPSHGPLVRSISVSPPSSRKRLVSPSVLRLPNGDSRNGDDSSQTEPESSQWRVPTPLPNAVVVDKTPPRATQDSPQTEPESPQWRVPTQLPTRPRTPLRCTQDSSQTEPGSSQWRVPTQLSNPLRTPPRTTRDSSRTLFVPETPPRPVEDSSQTELESSQWRVSTPSPIRPQTPLKATQDLSQTEPESPQWREPTQLPVIPKTPPRGTQDSSQTEPESSQWRVPTPSPVRPQTSLKATQDSPQTEPESSQWRVPTQLPVIPKTPPRGSQDSSQTEPESSQWRVPTPSPVRPQTPLKATQDSSQTEPDFSQWSVPAPLPVLPKTTPRGTQDSSQTEPESPQWRVPTQLPGHTLRPHTSPRGAQDSSQTEPDTPPRPTQDSSQTEPESPLWRVAKQLSPPRRILMTSKATEASAQSSVNEPELSQSSVTEPDFSPSQMTDLIREKLHASPVDDEPSQQQSLAGSPSMDEDLELHVQEDSSDSEPRLQDSRRLVASRLAAVVRWQQQARRDNDYDSQMSESPLEIPEDYDEEQSYDESQLGSLPPEVTNFLAMFSQDDGDPIAR